MYLELGKHNAPTWAIAAQVRIGELSYFKALKLVAIPAPAQVVLPSTRHQAVLYREAIDRIVTPLLKEANVQWVAAIKKAKGLCISNGWVRLAKMRVGQIGESEGAECPLGDVIVPYLSVTKAEFDKANAFYDRSFAHYKIKRAPLTTPEVDGFVTEVYSAASEAKDRFRRLADYGSGPWSVAARVRAGQVSDLQVKTLLSIPVPRSILVLNAPLVKDKKLKEYRAALKARAAPIAEQARKDWGKAINEAKMECIDDKWSALAQQHLAQP